MIPPLSISEFFLSDILELTFFIIAKEKYNILGKYLIYKHRHFYQIMSTNLSVEKAGIKDMHKYSKCPK